MKKLLIAGAMFAAAGSASANDWWFGGCQPWVGIDYKYTHVENRSNWPNAFAKDFSGGTIYVATKFMDYFGIEFGWDGTAKRNHTFTAVAGSTMGGATVTSTTGFQSSVKFDGLDLDLLGFWPIDKCMEAFINIGAGWVKPHVNMINLTGNIGTSNFIRDMVSISGKRRTVARIGIGVNWMVWDDCVGMRLKGQWESYQALRVTDNVGPGQRVLQDFKPFKDAWSVAIGVFAKL